MPDVLEIPVRKIIHIDMDAFFASVEMRDNPELRGKPVAVGSARERGVVAAANYEARKFGVHSAMPGLTAKHRCPHLVFVPPRFEVYKEVSNQIREIFLDYTPLVEPLSLDEAYLDVTVNSKGMPIATDIATEIRARILERTQLTASAGISFCKFLAKMASDQRKPNGQFLISPKNGELFMETLPIRKFHGVGPATADRMAALGIETGADLKAKSLEFLTAHFGKSGPYFHDLARAIDNRPVDPDRVRKSIGAEETFAADLHDLEEASSAVLSVCDEVWKRSEKHAKRGRTVTLKVKYADFEQITRAKSLTRSVRTVDEMSRTATALLENLHPFEKGIRLLGVTLSNFDGDGEDKDRSDRAGPQLELML